ncbi:MAG: nucleotidyltransferase family protein [Candidatus Izemoplasmatales bacterium]|nr:nucleotidyltransferase family protein [Candidatus Izemoplasmatales bacterium]MDD4595383.1 nucleotidyltransferase family protein [Candidatus Izemoplasmatales bacterium]
MVQGLILAGGLSSRAETNKMILRIRGMELICHTVEAMQDFVDDIFVVTGFYHESTCDAVNDYNKVMVVRNPFYERGMFSSVQYGSKFIDRDFFIIPGDVPFVEKSTYKKILSAKGMVRIPVHHGHSGHPVFVSKELLPDLRNEPKDSNLKLFLDKHHPTFVEVDDEAILFDVDTIEDLEKLKKQSKGNGI